MSPIKPLSAHLRELTDLADQQNMPTVQRWLLTENPAQWLDMTPREEELLAVTGRLIERLERAGFPFLPENLVLAYQETQRDPDAYIQTVLSEQRAKILEFFRQYPDQISDLEKKLRNLIRGGDREYAELRRLQDELENIESFIADSLHLSIPRIKPGASPETIERKLKTASQKFADQKVIEFRRKWDRVDTLTISLTQREADIDLLERRILIRQKLTERLAEIKRIIGASNPISETTPPSTSDDQSTFSSLENPPHPSETQPKPSKHRRPTSSASAPAAVTTKPTSAPTISPLLLSIQKIRQAMELAAQDDNRIRIVITNEPHRARHIQQWQALLTKMGFTGEIEFIDFPQNNGDLSPILIPRGLNTHDNRWSRVSLEAPYFVMDLGRPNLIANHLGDNGH